ncbi:MAG: hypothetical protein HKP14_08010 [Bacteroidia bacterium]|nr:hypothetical protein [Bacteroidia bacterium]
MKKIINFKTIMLSMFVVSIAFSACKDDEKTPTPDVTTSDTTVACNAFAKTIEENPAANLVLGTLDGTTNKGTPTFSLLSESPNGAFAVNAVTGELSVADESLYTIATNPTLTGTFEVSNGGQTTNCTITITLEDTASIALPDCGVDPTYTKIYDGTVQLKSQDDIDTFASSGWTEVTGKLAISGSTVTDMSGLRSIVKVGELTVWYISQSEDLNGLCNLQEIEGRLEIQSSNGLTSLKGLERLKTIGGELEISYCSKLENINALANLELVGYPSGGSFEYNNITLESLPKLVDLVGLDKLTATRELRIIENNSLTSLKGISGIKTAMNVFIETNPVLVNLNEVKLETVDKKVIIDGNAGLTSVDIATLTSSNELWINENNALLDLSGFANLTTLGNFAMFKNTALTTISGFNTIETIGTGGTVNKFYINNNQALTSITGFAKLKAIKGGFGINECRKLNSISAFKVEDIEGSLTLAYADLSNLLGLGNLVKLGASVAIRKNPKLTDFCALKPLLIGTGFSGSWSVVDNAANPTEADVKTNCP